MTMMLASVVPESRGHLETQGSRVQTGLMLMDFFQNVKFLRKRL